VPAGPVNTIDEVVADPQVKADRLIVSPDEPHPTVGAVPMPGFPVILDRTPPRARTAPPMLGQHSEEIRQSLSRADRIDKKKERFQ
jgi:crotonobetainyl-CoA:carnitine CoA-transferase CaiB-like acyl-CoA transferase